jgi:hypothetical protein
LQDGAVLRILGEDDAISGFPDRNLTDIADAKLALAIAERVQRKMRRPVERDELSNSR